MYFDGMDNGFNLICVLIAIGVFLFYRGMQKREQSWIIGWSVYSSVWGPLLVFLGAVPGPADAWWSGVLHRVARRGFHRRSAMAWPCWRQCWRRYQSFRRIGIVLGIVAVDLALPTAVGNLPHTDPPSPERIFHERLGQGRVRGADGDPAGRAAFSVDTRSSESESSVLSPCWPSPDSALVC